MNFCEVMKCPLYNTLVERRLCIYKGKYLCAPQKIIHTSMCCAILAPDGKLYNDYENNIRAISAVLKLRESELEHLE